MMHMSDPNLYLFIVFIYVPQGVTSVTIKLNSLEYHEWSSLVNWYGNLLENAKFKWHSSIVGVIAISPNKEYVREDRCIILMGLYTLSYMI